MIGGGVLTLWWLNDDDVIINDDDVDGFLSDDVDGAVDNDNGNVIVNDDWWWWCWCTGDRYKASPLSSLGVSQAPITYFFLFSNKLLMKIIWEWPPLFSLIGFSIGCNFEFDIKVHCDLPFIKHSFFLKLIFLLSQAWYIEFLKQKHLWHITKHFHNLFLQFCVTNPKNIKSVYLVLILTSLTKILFLKKPHGIEDFEYQESIVPYIIFLEMIERQIYQSNPI